MNDFQSLLVVSHVVHYAWEEKLFAYGPYAREIDIWADLFPEVIIASPLRREKPPGDVIAFTRTNISIRPQLKTGGDGLGAKIAQIVLLPLHALRLGRAMRRANAIHVRCPGNLGLLGCLLAPIFRKPIVAKYAGQWNGYRGERFAVRLQRQILASRWWRGPVTVYGKWPNQPAHVIPFFTSMMTRPMVQEAERHSRQMKLGVPLKILFVGRLAPEKRIGALLEAVKVLQNRSVPVELTIVGGGPEDATLRAQARELGITDGVTFTGALPYEAGLKQMESGHCLVLPSQHSEGWPKVIAEAMCYGLVCLGVRHGQVPDMLNGRGLLLETGEPEEIADQLEWVTRNSPQAATLAQAGSRWAVQYSLEGLRSELAKLLEREWKVTLRAAKDWSAIQSDSHV